MDILPVLNPLTFYPRFSHIIEKIFKTLDNKSLSNCREVAKSWQNLIDDRKLSWIQIVNIPTMLRKEDTYLHTAAKTGHTEMFEMILRNGDVKDLEDAYFFACENGHLEIAQILMQESVELNIDLNADDFDGNTALHLACINGHFNIAVMILEKIYIT